MSWSGGEVVWRSLTPEGIDSTEQVSPKLGSGDYAQISPDVQTIRAKPGYYIADLQPYVSEHTSGETFVHDIKVSFAKLPIGG
jgi:hypothetical protein